MTMLYTRAHWKALLPYIHGFVDGGRIKYDDNPAHELTHPSFAGNVEMYTLIPARNNSTVVQELLKSGTVECGVSLASQADADDSAKSTWDVATRRTIVYYNSNTNSFITDIGEVWTHACPIAIDPYLQTK